MHVHVHVHVHVTCTYTCTRHMCMCCTCTCTRHMWLRGRGIHLEMAGIFREPYSIPPPALEKFCILAPTRGRAARSPCEAAPWSASTARPPALEHVLSGVARTVGLHAADQLPGLRARHVAPLGSCRMQVDSSATR